MKKILLFLTLLISAFSFSQETLKQDTLRTVTVEGSRKGIKKSLNVTANTTLITSKELLKAACCNLSESFETNPSIDVSFTDAITGNKQIKMLGLTNAYILMSEGNIPVVRGALQTNGFSFVPGTWVSSIQITKGAGSVAQGYESISGHINYEVLKPIDAELFFANAYASNDGRYELNLHFKNDYSDKLSSMVFFHGNTRNVKIDMNHDHFLDNPLGQQINLLNRWQYSDPEKGIVSFLNIKYFKDDRIGGQMHYDPDHTDMEEQAWGSHVLTDKIELSNKTGYVFPDMPFQSIGFQNAFQYNKVHAQFGNNLHHIHHKSYISNLLFNSIINNTYNKFITGLSFAYDQYEEHVELNFMKDFSRTDNSVGAFFEYSYDNLDNLSVVLGARVDNHNRLGLFFTPRFHFKYNPFEKTVIRLSAGRGKRTANIFAENQQLLASSRQFSILDDGSGAYGLKPEIAWNYGVGMVQKFNIFSMNADVSVDFYKTDFQNQVVVDLFQSAQQVDFYNLKGKSFTSSLQLEFNLEIIKHLNLRTSYKFYDNKIDYNSGSFQRPLQAKQRFFGNLEFETAVKEKGQQWKFDYTFNWIGEQQLPNTATNPVQDQLEDFSKPYTLMNAQITRTFSSTFEVYLGGENIGNYKQDKAILGSDNPFGPSFDSSVVYAPVFGAMYYAGLRFKIK